VALAIRIGELPCGVFVPYRRKLHTEREINAIREVPKRALLDEEDKPGGDLLRER
jgi:hypothetical protein